ncbi:hypothetical protein VP1G_04463 [Cytospora mali]|uniref:Uncharacterized protein n=1 Tax=Cytospora mali TaxID=578113 RepID=A0A194UZN8_CYTMA|nr:hypothetical protein VP1G_04463 [Valsa mali var. pyri (nom. inval.)]
MSRTSFSIRKLINQRRTWPDEDSDNEETFECSSAKTIRLQYELEQYQQQQLQKDVRHHSRGRSSWMGNNSSPKRKGHKRIPKPIVVVGHHHHTNDIVVHNGSATKRISMPFPLSSLTGRTSPGTPESHSSGSSLCSYCGGGGGGDCSQQHQGHDSNSKSAASPYFDTRLSTPAMTGALTPSKAMHNHEHAAEFVKAAESYTLKPAVETGDAKNGEVGGKETPRAMQPPLQLPVDDDDTCEGFIGGDDEEEDCETIPDNVQQLIWQTDKAFKAVGTALAEVRFASHSQPQSKEPQDQVQQLQRASRVMQTQTPGLDNIAQILPPATHQNPVLRTRNIQGVISPISPTSGRGSISSTSRKCANKSSPLSPSPDILRSPTRASSIKKAKRKSPSRPKTPRSATTAPSTPGIWPDLPSTTPKSSTFGPSTTRQVSNNSSSGHRAHHSYSRSLSRWNLKADNVTEKLFNGSRSRFGLHKIEADEVVTPSQVQQYRQSRIAKAQAEAQAEALKSNSSESLRSNAGSIGGGNSDANSSANTPVEPFHLQDLPSRIGNSGVNLNVLSPVPEVPTPRSFTFEAEKTTPRDSTSWTEPKTPTIGTKQARQEQTPLATPPPTPPQPSPSASAAFAATPAAENVYLHPTTPTKTPTRPTHKRGNSSSSRIPILPTIPEVRITAPQVHKALPTPQCQGCNPSEPQTQRQDEAGTTTATITNPYFEEDDEHMFFQSTPYTQTMPAFQHGRIRLAKADLVDNGMINSFESRLLSSPDEGLDWTAFQMAILGGAGDLLSDPCDFLSRDAHEDLVDDLCDWWGGCGMPLDALGTLVTAQEEKRTMATPTTLYNPVPYTVPFQVAFDAPGTAAGSFYDPSRNHIYNRNSSGGTTTARSSGVLSDEEEMLQVQSMPIPLTSEHPSGFWNTRPFDASRFFTGEGCGLKRWTLEGHPKRYQGPGIDVIKANAIQSGGDKSLKPAPGNHGGGSMRNGKAGVRGTTRESVDSLPQSPMLDLVMTTAVDGSKEYVPMGYNLGHDLGDFLKWESENVYATAFYGAD